MKPTLLIIDDNRAFTDSVVFALNDFSVIKAHTLAEARGKLRPDTDLILLDLVFNETRPDKLEGLAFIPYLRENYPDTPVVVLTNYPSIETTVQAIKAGATDFLNKRNLNWTEWKIRLMNYARSSSRIRELKQRNTELERIDDDTDILGSSSSIDFVRRRLRDLAQNSSDVSIFLVGETGTGKNHAARYFRKYSARAKKAYKEFSILELSESLVESELFGHVKGAFTGAVNDKKGLFELADGGILFLDEIGDYDLKIQTKILRFLDNKTITPVGSGKSKKLDLQLILASNQDIPALIKEKRFREDLYQRINRIRIELPTLRSRIEEIPLLTQYFFAHFKEKEKTKLVSVDPSVIDLLSEYSWPGNIRELQSVIWDACTKARLFGDTKLQPQHLKKELIDSASSSRIFPPLDDFESTQEKIVMLELRSIDEALQKSFGQKAVAAAMLGMTADQLRYKVLKQEKLHPNLFYGFKNIMKAYKLKH